MLIYGKDKRHCRRCFLIGGNGDVRYSVRRQLFFSFVLPHEKMLPRCFSKIVTGGNGRGAGKVLVLLRERLMRWKSGEATITSHRKAFASPSLDKEMLSHSAKVLHRDHVNENAL